MHRCDQCDGTLRRIHRTFFERFSYLAVYECHGCKRQMFIPRPYRFHFGSVCRCPRCGTYHLNKLKRRDKIDPLDTGVWNLLERLVGGKLYHCRYCRLQFYDRRNPRPASESAEP